MKYGQHNQTFYERKQLCFLSGGAKSYADRTIKPCRFFYLSRQRSLTSGLGKEAGAAVWESKNE